MGGGASSSKTVSEGSNKSNNSFGKGLSYYFRSSNSSLISEGSESILSPEEAEFKSRLSNGIFLQYLSNYSKLINKHYFISILDVIDEYFTVGSSNETVDSLCLLLYPRQEYFPMAAEYIRLCNESNEDDNCHVQERTVLLNQLRQCCFHLLYEHIYKPFSISVEYTTMCTYLDNSGSWEMYESFQYLNLFAQGAFGVVVQCRSISTNQLFAMKIQSKMQLLRQFRHDKDRVTREMAASVVFSHPYIAGIAYAFQTQTLVMLVSPVSACGDLRRSQSLCPDHRMSLDRVVFYTAEISSALMYMHLHEIMYRDLKPGNVLLNADGHIMLADFGSLTGNFIE